MNKIQSRPLLFFFKLMKLHTPCQSFIPKSKHLIVSESRQFEMSASVIPVSRFFTMNPTPVPQRHLIEGQEQSKLFSHTTRRYTVRMQANSNVVPTTRRSNKEVIMVDPVEAKKLAAKQMEEIKAKEKFQRRRQIEAINGGWAMIGLTAGLIIEAQTGKGFLGQVNGYWDAILGLFIGLAVPLDQIDSVLNVRARFNL